MPDLSLSVVMPTYNRASYIEEALSSLADQTRPAEQVIVVDDCSTDETARRVESHSLCPRILYHRQSHNQGASVARNLGVAKATGSIIVFLDSDDVLERNHHERVIDIFSSQPQTGLFCCDARMIDPLGQPLSDRTFSEVQSSIKGIEVRTGPRRLTDIFTFSTSFPGMAVRREVYLQVDGLDQELFPLDDFDLQLKVAATEFLVHYEHVPLARYRVHLSNESGPGKAVRVGRQKLRCVRLARQRFAPVGALGWGALRRQGEVRRELALALLKNRTWPAGLWELGRSLAEDPFGVTELLRIATRKLGFTGGRP